MPVVKEAVISEGPTNWMVRDLYRAEVSFHGDRVIAIMHTSLGQESDKLTGVKLPTGKGTEVILSGLAMRRQHLMTYVQNELGDAPSLPEALSRAFEKMNEHLLEEIPDVKEFLNGLWQCQYNTLVVVVDQAQLQVFVAGTAAASQAMLVRNGKMKLLTRRVHSTLISVFRKREPVKQTQLCFLKEETLTRDDEYLVVLSPHVLGNVRSHSLPAVLQTRHKFLGLETACAQIVTKKFPYDISQRLLIVMPLHVGEDKVSRTTLSVKELGSYGTVSDSEDDDNDKDGDAEDGGEEDGDKEEEDGHKEAGDEEDGDKEDPLASLLTYLEPLDCKPDGEWREGKTSIRLVSPGKVVCKFMSTTLVITKGDITDWEVTEKKAAVVIPTYMIEYMIPEWIGREFFFPSACKVPVLVNRWPRDINALAEGYRAAVSKAHDQGYQCIAFLAVGCGRSRCSPWEVARMAVDTMIDCGGKFEEVHFVLDDSAWRAWVAATDLLPCMSEETYVKKLAKINI